MLLRCEAPLIAAGMSTETGDLGSGLSELTIQRGLQRKPVRPPELPSGPPLPSSQQPWATAVAATGLAG